jgi:hypothetical protein
VNHFYGLKNFIRQWEEKPRTLPTVLKPLPKSEEGHINLDGTPTCIEARIFPRWHPQFEVALEEGIKELVCELIEKLDCITYTSCQGHLVADSDSAGQNGPLQPRHVGILPRNSTEHLYLLGVLTKAANKANGRTVEQKIRIVLRSEILTSEESDRKSLNITFVDSGERVEDYFERVEDVYREFIKELQVI